MLTGLEFSSPLIATYNREERESGRGEVEESQGGLKGAGEARAFRTPPATHAHRAWWK